MNKNFWRNIFIIISIIILIVVLTPLLLRISTVKEALSWWTKPTQKNSITYFVIVGILLAMGLAVSGAMWQSDRKAIAGERKKEYSNLCDIYSELNKNKTILELKQNYLNANSINRIIFYLENESEYWILEDGTEKEVSCKKTKGISIKFDISKRFLLDKIFSIEDKSLFYNVYTDLDNINTANGVDAKSYNNLYETIVKVLEIIKSKINS